ncbi:MAG: C40 family peptidase [Spirochaetales bacterium]|nr:C40 family peptidase [Spirochaetales bacterium]
MENVLFPSSGMGTGNADAQLDYFNARWYDADTGRFITEDPIRAGQMWFAYANNNPMRFIDPSGLISEEHESILKSLASAGTSQEEITGTRSEFIDSEISEIQELEKQIFLDNNQYGPDARVALGEDYENAVNNYLRNIIDSDYSDRSDVADEILNSKLAYEGLKLVGSEYMWGGKPDNNLGGLDCSGTAETVMERAVNILVGQRNANGQATDPNLTIPGNGSRGTLNFYDWKVKGVQDGKYDHVSIELGNGKIINPNGGEMNNRVGFDGPVRSPGIIEIRDPFNTAPTNRQVNWHYMLFE